MNNRLPTFKAIDIIKVLQALGFCKIRQKGSHIFLKHKDGRTTIIPIHKGEDIGRGLMRKILREINITIEEFSKYL